MKTFLIVISIILFIISFGSMLKHRKQNKDGVISINLYLLEYSKSWGKLLFTFFILLPLIMLFVSINSLTGLKWYWNILIFWVITGFRDIFSTLYSLLFGYKSKPTFSLIEGRMIKYNLHIVDAIITFILGLIFYFIAINL